MPEFQLSSPPFVSPGDHVMFHLANVHDNVLVMKTEEPAPHAQHTQHASDPDSVLQVIHCLDLHDGPHAFPGMSCAFSL